MRKAVRRFAAAASVAVVAAVAAPAMPATASEIEPMALYNCAHGKNTTYQYAWAHCSGSGEYRAVAYCQNVVNGQRTVRFGPFVNAPSESIALCSSQERVYDSALQQG